MHLRGKRLPKRKGGKESGMRGRNVFSLCSWTGGGEIIWETIKKRVLSSKDDMQALFTLGGGR